MTLEIFCKIKIEISKVHLYHEGKPRLCNCAIGEDVSRCISKDAPGLALSLLKINRLFFSSADLAKRDMSRLRLYGCPGVTARQISGTTSSSRCQGPTLHLTASM